MTARLQMSAEALTAFLEAEFPQVAPEVSLEALSPLRATMRLRRGERHLRPGGTISGPSMALLVDVTFYLALLGMIGPKPMAVTTNLALNFLRRPRDADLLCDAHILKLGRRLATGDARLYSDGGTPDEPVAHATLTYALP